MFKKGVKKLKIFELFWLFNRSSTIRKNDRLIQHLKNDIKCND